MVRDNGSSEVPGGLCCRIFCGARVIPRRPFFGVIAAGHAHAGGFFLSRREREPVYACERARFSLLCAVGKRRVGNGTVRGIRSTVLYALLYESFGVASPHFQQSADPGTGNLALS